MGMFDIKHNSWYRCTPDLRCENFPIKKILDPMIDGANCPDKEQRCDEDQLCFVHRVNKYESSHECVDQKRVKLIADTDGTRAKEEPDGESTKKTSNEVQKRLEEGKDTVKP